MLIFEHFNEREWFFEVAQNPKNTSAISEAAQYHWCHHWNDTFVWEFLIWIDCFHMWTKISTCEEKITSAQVSFLHVRLKISSLKLAVFTLSCHMSSPEMCLFHMLISTLSHGICFFHTWSQISTCEGELTPRVHCHLYKCTSDRLCTNYDISSIKHSVFTFEWQKFRWDRLFKGNCWLEFPKAETKHGTGNHTTCSSSQVSSTFSHIFTCWLAIWTNVLTCKNKWMSHVNIYTTNGHFWQTNSTFPKLNYICS